MRLFDREVAEPRLEVEHEGWVTFTEEVELGAHEHGGGDRRAEGSGSGFDDEGERAVGVVGAVRELEGRAGFEERGEVEAELFGFSGDDSGLEREA